MEVSTSEGRNKISKFAIIDSWFIVLSLLSFCFFKLYFITFCIYLKCSKYVLHVIAVFNFLFVKHILHIIYMRFSRIKCFWSIKSQIISRYFRRISNLNCSYSNLAANCCTSFVIVSRQLQTHRIIRIAMSDRPFAITVREIWTPKNRAPAPSRDRRVTRRVRLVTSTLSIFFITHQIAVRFWIAFIRMI